MAPVPWATPEQHTFLVENCHSFIEAQKTKTIHKFWVAVNRDWFEKWPEPGTERLNIPGISKDEKDELGKKIDERKKKIKQWFNNHGNKSRKSKRVVFRVGVKTRRRPQLIEFYSHKVYDEKIKARVEEEMTENKIPSKDRLAVGWRIAQDIFEDEPEEIKQAIIAEFEAVEPPASQKNGESASAVTAQSMADTIASLDDILDEVFGEISQQTGWTFSLMAGGPDPINGGRIATYAYHWGKNGLGVSFGRAHPTFEETIQKPFADFLKGVYPKSVRAARALGREPIRASPTSENETNEAASRSPATTDDDEDSDKDEDSDEDVPHAVSTSTLPTATSSFPAGASTKSPQPLSLLPASFVPPSGFVFPAPIINSAPKKPVKKATKAAAKTTTSKSKSATVAAAAKKGGKRATDPISNEENEGTDGDIDPLLLAESRATGGNEKEKETEGTGGNTDPVPTPESTVGEADVGENVNESKNKRTTSKSKSATVAAAAKKAGKRATGPISNEENEGTGGETHPIPPSESTTGGRGVSEKETERTDGHTSPVLTSELTTGGGSANEKETEGTAGDSEPVLPADPRLSDESVGEDENENENENEKMDVDADVAAPRKGTGHGIRKPAARKVSTRKPKAGTVSSDVADIGSSLPNGNGRRVRKPTASKEIVPLVDKRRALEALSNPKKKKSKTT